MTTSKPAAKPAAKAAPKPAAKPAPAEVVEHSDLAHALSAFQAECPPIRKGNRATVPTKSGGQYSYDYADLSDVLEVVAPVLGRHGLSFTCMPTLTKHGFGLKYRLQHTSGSKLRGFYPLPDPARIAPQEMGSLLTYDRRYILCSLLGIAPGGDDNEERLPAPVERPAQRPAQRPAPQAQRPAEAAPARDFRAEAVAATGDRDKLSALWQEARAAGAPVEILDGIAALGRAATPLPADEAPAPEEAPAPAEDAPDPGNPEDEAPAAAPAEEVSA